MNVAPKTSGLCQAENCMRVAAYQPTIRVWPVGTPSNLTTRCIEMKLRVRDGVCKRHADAVGPDDVMNVLVRAEIENAMRKRYNALPDMGSLQVIMRRM